MTELKEKINLKDIKSSYIVKEMFSFLEEKQKLNLIINNKHLQNLIGVDIKYYIKISGKYKAGERNGIGKVYKLFTNELIFEGEFSNGKKNGKGKEYDGRERFFSI